MSPADDRRDASLRWNLTRLYATLNTARTKRGESWPQVAAHLHCTPAKLTGLRAARFAVGMRLAMRITQALHRPASDFIDLAVW